jgi:ABC-type multidrug transport system ATPase subunit
MNICGRVILLDQGKIVWDGKLNDYKTLVAKKMSKRRKKDPDV